MPLRRTSQWEPPTLLDHLLSSPLVLLSSLAYRFLVLLRAGHLLPTWFYPKASGTRPIRIVCVSDTHDMTIRDVPDGDLLIHAGDMSSRGLVSDVQAQLDWLASLPHRHKVVVSGNHDECFLPAAPDRRSALDLRGIHYLENSSVTLEFDGGRRLKVHGSPYMEPWEKLPVPMETDVLVTHQPPKSHMDLDLGDPALLAELWRVRPRLHVFGHVHWGHGREPAYFDGAQHAYETLLARPRRGLVRDVLPHAGWLDALRMLFHGMHAVLWRLLMLGPGGQLAVQGGCLLVNAAQAYGNTGKLGRKPQVVDM